MCNSSHRNGRICVKPMGVGVAWQSPSPKAEARECVKIALSNGGLAAMRALIAVSEQEKADLLAWAGDDPKLGEKIERAVAFREAVLREFDRISSAVPA